MRLQLIGTQLSRILPSAPSPPEMPVPRFALRSTVLVILALGSTVLAADKKPKRVHRPHAVKPSKAPAAPPKAPEPEEVPLPLQEEAPAAPPASDAPMKTSDADAEPKAPGGLSARASLESSGYADTDHVYVGSPSVGFSVADDVAGWSIRRSLPGRRRVGCVGGHLVDRVQQMGRSPSRRFRRREPEARRRDVRGIRLRLARAGLSVAHRRGTLTIDLLEKNVTPSSGSATGTIRSAAPDSRANSGPRSRPSADGSA